MMMNQKVRARVLKVEGETVTLGVFLEGAWHRIQARTQVTLQSMSWIEGWLIVPPDGSMIWFKVLDAPSGGSQDQSSAPLNQEIDLEA